MKAGIGVCVNDAVDEVKEISDWETTNPGGKGAVRGNYCENTKGTEPVEFRHI